MGTLVVVGFGLSIAAFFFIRTLRGGSGRKKRLEQLQAENPPPEPYDIVQLMAQDAEETGVGEIAGGEGLPMPVKLKVWWRDAPAHEGAPRDTLRYVIQPGVAPEEATEESVRLVTGDREWTPLPEPEPIDAPEPADAAQEDPPGG